MLPEFREDLIQDNKKLVLYGKAIESVKTILTGRIDDENVREAFELVDGVFRIMVKDPDTHQDMFKLFQKHPTLFSHSANVCLL